jgi:hypothetical protein
MRYLIGRGQRAAYEIRQSEKSDMYGRLFSLTENIGIGHSIAKIREGGYKVVEKHDSAVKLGAIGAVTGLTALFGALTGGLGLILSFGLYEYFKSGKDAKEKYRQKAAMKIEKWEKKMNPVPKQNPVLKQKRSLWNYLFYI